ncbi:hypothetical protein A2U01_0037331, partial [Trifolium medium]|nr:hypothetical protein [Trifolium medium]
MAPKRANKKMVVRSTRKVVEESVQVSVVSSNKRSTRANKDVEIDKDVGSDQREEHVRIIPVQVTPSAKEDSNVSTTTFTTEDITKQENTPNEATMEPKEPEKKVKTKEGNYGKEKRKRKRMRRMGEGYQRYVYR